MIYARPGRIGVPDYGPVRQERCNPQWSKTRCRYSSDQSTTWPV